MVYIGPTRHLAPRLKPKHATGYKPDQGLIVNKDKKSPRFVVPRNIERRKRNDRREARHNALLDSRSGQDRRKNDSHRINVDV